MSNESGDPIELDAGEFGRWLGDTRNGMIDGTDADVPCGSCAACCRSSQFVHIAADETKTLARIPHELLVPAPGGPDGDMVLGYDQRGHCPMLVDDRCSIYSDRPRTCREYDCRVFAASQLIPKDSHQREIATRVRQWRFNFARSRDQEEQAAVASAARFMVEHPECFPRGVPSDPQQISILAVKVYEVFLGTNEPGMDDEARRRLALQIMEGSREFEAKRRSAQPESGDGAH